MLRMRDVTALKDVAENLNTRKSTINWVRVLRTGVMKMALRKTLRRFVLSSWIKHSSGFLPAFVNKTEPTTNCERNLSPMILKGNQMVYSRNQEIISRAFQKYC